MSKDKSILSFPCQFQIKIMGKNKPEFIEQMHELVLKHYPEIDVSTFSQRLSKGDKYLSLSVTVNAQSKEQLDNIYQEISGHKLVVMAL